MIWIQAKVFLCTIYLFIPYISFIHVNSDLEAAKNVIEVMKQNGFSPTSETYVSLLRAHLEHKDVDGVKKLMEHCEQNNIFLSEQSLMELICDMADNDTNQPIKEVFFF